MLNFIIVGCDRPVEMQGAGLAISSSRDAVVFQRKA